MHNSTFQLQIQLRPLLPSEAFGCKPEFSGSVETNPETAPFPSDWDFNRPCIPENVRSRSNQKGGKGAPGQPVCRASSAATTLARRGACGGVSSGAPGL